MSICDLYGKRGPCLLAVRRSSRLGTTGPLSCRSLRLTRSQGPRSRRSRSRFCVVSCKVQPSRSHKVYKHSKSAEKYIRQHNILRFDITMRDTQIMQIFDSLSDIANDESSLLLCDFALLELLIKRASVHILQHAVEMSFIFKEAVHAKDIAMGETALDANL